MKHFFAYQPDGHLYLAMVHTGGHADDCHIDDPDCTNELSQAIRAAAQRASDKNGITMAGIVEFTCPCDSEMGVCDCPSNKRTSAYYCTTNECLVDKPTSQVLVNGVAVETGDELVKVPGSLFTVKVVCAEAPDGATVNLGQTALHAVNGHILTFANGATNEITLTTPAQGITGAFSLSGLYTCPVQVSIKAFA